MNRQELIAAIDAALAGAWDDAHARVQEEGSPDACLAHGLLHEIEGDRDNAAYWYRRAGAASDPSLPPVERLRALRERLSGEP